MDDHVLECYFIMATETRSLLTHHPTTGDMPSLLLTSFGAGRGRQAPWVDNRFGGNILSHSHQLLPLKVHHTTVTSNSLGATADNLVWAAGLEEDKGHVVRCSILEALVCPRDKEP